MSTRILRPLFLLSLGLGAPAMAVDYLWNVPSGNWSTAGNWTPGAGAGGPNTADAAIIRNGGTVTYDASANANVNRPLIGRDGTGTLNMNSGTHTANSYLFVGAAYNQNSSGTLNLTGGTLNINGGWQHWGSASTYSGESTGGQASVNGTAVINVSGTAVLNSTNGGNQNHLGWTEGAANGGSGAGTLNLSGGTVSFAGPVTFGNDQNGTGNGTARGTINQTAGSLSTGSWLVVGQNSVDGTGTYNFSGGTLSVGGGQSLHVGIENGRGFYLQSGTASANVGGLIVGRNGGIGTMTLTGGTLTSSGAANLGLSGGTTHLNMQGGTLTLNSSVGAAQASSFFNATQTGGTVNATANNWIELAQGNSGNATYNLSGGVLNVNGSGGTFSVGTRGTARLTMSGNSILNVANQMIIARAHENQNNHATFTMQGGTATVGALRVGENNGNATFSLEGGTLRTTQIIRGSGDLFNWGNGTLQVRTEVPGDVGVTDRTLAPTPSGPVVREGKVISYTGDLSTGFGAQQSSRLDLSGFYQSNGTRYNQLSVSGALNLGATDDTLNMNLNPYFLRPSSTAAEDYGTLIVVDAASIVGTFDHYTGFINDNIGWSEAAGSGVYDSNTNPASLPLNSYFWEYRTTGPQTGNLLFHYRVSFSVPEPATFGMLCASVLALRTGRRLRDLRQRIDAA